LLSLTSPRAGLVLPSDSNFEEALRFHPALKFNESTVGGVVALFRDVSTNAPCGIHRTFLDRDGRKLDRRMLGRVKGAAIKLDRDEDVTLGLVIGEGLETCLAAYLAGLRPTWVLGSAGAIASFPVLAGIEAISILGERDDNGVNDRAAQQCAARWSASGQEAFHIEPLVGGDFNDAWQALP
jgi:putative DNA primase/helicase